MRTALAIAVALLCACGVAEAQSGGGTRKFGVAYYDIGALYDTLPSKFYDDRAYTPQGRMRWDTRRYRRKIGNTARVIDSMSMDVVVLYGVENERVVRDIAEACGCDYTYIYCTADSRDGLDFAMLYLGDSFFPRRVTPWRGALCVEGETADRSLTIVADRLSTSAGVLLAERGVFRNNNIIILGRHNKLKFDERGLADRTLRAERAGRGNCFRRGRWEMRDRVFTDIDDGVRCDVYVRGWMLTPDGRPLATFDGAAYRGGFSECLPVFIYFDVKVGY